RQDRIKGLNGAEAGVSFARMRTATITAVIAVVAAIAATSAAAANTGYFKTSDGSIWCVWGGGVQCGIKNGFLKPKPKNNCKGSLDSVGNRIGFAAKGKAKVVACAGDAGPFGNPKATKVLKAGKTWKKGGMSCTARRSSMTCKNKSHHGFMVSRASYRTF